MSSMMTQHRGERRMQYEPCCATQTASALFVEGAQRGAFAADTRSCNSLRSCSDIAEPKTLRTGTLHKSVRMRTRIVRSFRAQQDGASAVSPLYLHLATVLLASLAWTKSEFPTRCSENN